MSSFGDLIEDVSSYLYSFGQDRDKVTTLTQSLNSSATSFTVADARQVDRGFIEIDSEIMAVLSSDPSTSTVILHPWGRGQKGTAAVAHSANVMVSNTPRFPRSRIAADIKQTVLDLYPELWQVQQDETNIVNPAQVTYPLPAAAESVISVQYQSTGPSKMWVPVTRYKMDYNADLTAFPTGKSLDIYVGMTPGRKIKIQYRTKFGAFVNETDTFASVGLEESYRDIIRLGAMSRLILAADPARLDLDSIESSARGQMVQPLSATSMAKQFLQLQQLRIAEERRRLLNQYPSSQVRWS